MTSLARKLPWILIPSLIAACIEVDLTVPGFPQMAKYFQVSEAKIQWTLTFNFLGFAVFSLFLGPLSDAIGRRKLIVCGFFLFCVGSFGCAYTNSLTILYICRFLQGIGASAIWIIVFPIIVDVYQGIQASHIIGILNSVITASLAIAPIIGSFICDSYGWQVTYLVIAIASFVSFLVLAVYLPETNVTKKPLQCKIFISNYKALLFDMRFMIYALIPSVFLGGYMAYIGTIPFLFINSIGMTLNTFAIYQALVIGSFAVVSFYIGKIEKHIGFTYCVKLGIIFYLLLLWLIFVLASL